MFLLIFINFIYADKLISVQLLARHGDRGATIDIPGLNYSYPLDKLTPEGVLQHRNLGNFIKTHYAEFLTNKFDVKNVYLRSSSIPRCLSSLWALTDGIYPNKIPDDVRIEKSKFITEDFVLRSFSFCYVIKNLSKKYVDSEEYQKEMRRLENIFAELTKILNYKVTKSNYMAVLDALIVQNEHHALNENYIHFIDDMLPSRYLYHTNYPHLNFKAYQRAAMGVFFYELFFSNMDADLSDTPPNSSPNTKKELRIYLGHDYTLIAFFSAFNITIDSMPYYASTIMIELWEEEEKKQGERKEGKEKNNNNMREKKNEKKMKADVRKTYIRMYYQRDKRLAREGQLWEDAEITNIMMGCPSKGKCYRDPFLDYWKDVVVSDPNTPEYRNTICGVRSLEEN